MMPWLLTTQGSSVVVVGRTNIRNTEEHKCFFLLSRCHIEINVLGCIPMLYCMVWSRFNVVEEKAWKSLDI